MNKQEHNIYNTDNTHEKSTFLKYGLAAMINEYNSLENIEQKKEYLDAIIGWYMREKTNIEYICNTNTTL